MGSIEFIIWYQPRFFATIMSMITTADIEHLAKLARIKLDDAEKQSLAGEIDAILSYVDQIKKATVDVDYAPVAGMVSNVSRSDTALQNKDREAILQEAPSREGDFVLVKKIIAQD